MAAPGEVSALQGGLAALFSRPKTNYESLEKQTVAVTPRSTDLVYIRACSECKFTFHGRAAKCIVESSRDVRLEFEEPLASGTLEMISSKSVTISINPQDKLPTVSADDCHDVHLYFYDPRALGSIYTVNCSNVVVHLQPPYKEEMTLDLPTDSTEQFVSTLQRGKMVTELVVREGAGYLTTAAKFEAAEKRDKELQRRFEEHVLGLLGLPRAPGERGQESRGGETRTTRPQPKKEKEGAGEGGSGVSSGSKADDVGSPEEEGGDDGPLVSALRAKRRDLKPTETVERHLPVVGTGRPSGGRFNPAIESEAEKREFFDSEKELTKKLDKTAQWIRESKHIIVFTGAGVSTSSGIPDFRSGMNTVLPTGPGVWELHAQGGDDPGKTRKIVPLIKALPSPTHMAIVKLHEEEVVKYTISQNVDGLHRRSGLRPAQLSELHGNTNLETCEKCHRQYLRDFETREAAHVHEHQTSRLCDDPSCRGVLQDSIINFGEMLPKRDLENAFIHAQKADLCIVLGSSLRVKPACQVPEVVQAAGGKVVICNLQRIPQFLPDNKTMQVFCTCDNFMSGVMERLALEIPPFVLMRRARFSSVESDGVCKLTVTGLDSDEDVPYSFIKSILVSHNGSSYKATEEPLTISLPSASPDDLKDVQVTMEFHGHYGEESLTVSYDVSAGVLRIYTMKYDVAGRSWTVE